MQRNSNLRRTRVMHAVQPNRVVDIRHLVCAMRRPALELQRERLAPRPPGRLINSLGQLAGEDLENAVRVGVVVDGGAFAGSPDEEQLRCSLEGGVR